MDLQDNQYVVEDLSILFDSSTSVGMFQRNRNSIGPTKICEYFNLILKDVSAYENKIAFHPIVRADTYKSLRKKEIITKIDIKTSDINNNNLPHEFKSLFQPSIIEGLEIELTLSVGRSRIKNYAKRIC